MKKTTRIILIVIASLFIVLLGIFWGRFAGAYNIFQLTGKIQDVIQAGSDKLDFRLNASWVSENKSHHLVISLHYKTGEDFYLNLNWDNKQYHIESDANKTQVITSKPALLIAGKGNDRIDFDLFLMLGQICANHPIVSRATDLPVSKRLLLAVWAFFNLDFRDDAYQDIDCKVVTLPEDIFDNEIEIWMDFDEKYDYRIVSTDMKNPLEIVISDEMRVPDTKEVDSTSTQKITVERKELNTAIYRGAIRAAGILLENNVNPVVDGEEKTWGKSRLIYVEGNRVLLGKGSHRELGEAHGALLKKEARDLVDATLYTIGWFYTLNRKHWFLEDMRHAYKRLEPYIPPKYQEEMAGLAETSGISLDEVRLANVFPALFHCSGFGLFGKATKDEVLYHGRILDYIVDAGLQYKAVVYVYDPEPGHAFTNIGYAGFIGSVSGMNEHQVAFGEMGGRGEGDWDGMPMGLLMREGLERAQTLDEALAIFRDTPRTCEYYYVISDGKIPDARGLATTSQMFVTIKPNQFHPQLPHPFPDAVLLSAGKRYEKLVERVKENYGKIDHEKAIRLMDRPVAMRSDLHNVLFVPQKLEFWVANASANEPACTQPYTRYSLKDLLEQLSESLSQ